MTNAPLPVVCEPRDRPDETYGGNGGISLSEIVAGVGAMAQYVDENGDLPNAIIAEAFREGLIAAKQVLRQMEFQNEMWPPKSLWALETIVHP